MRRRLRRTFVCISFNTVYYSIQTNLCAFDPHLSQNPGGPGEDFGIKYNLEYGQPAGEDFTDEVRSAMCEKMIDYDVGYYGYNDSSLLPTLAHIIESSTI